MASNPDLLCYAFITRSHLLRLLQIIDDFESKIDARWQERQQDNPRYASLSPNSICCKCLLALVYDVCIITFSATWLYSCCFHFALKSFMSMTPTFSSKRIYIYDMPFFCCSIIFFSLIIFFVFTS